MPMEYPKHSGIMMVHLLHLKTAPTTSMICYGPPFSHADLGTSKRNVHIDDPLPQPPYHRSKHCQQTSWNLTTQNLFEQVLHPMLFCTSNCRPPNFRPIVGSRQQGRASAPNGQTFLLLQIDIHARRPQHTQHHQRVAKHQFEH